MPTTLRVELDRAGFDWKDGVVLLERRERGAGATRPQAVKSDDAVLDNRYGNGLGLQDMPRIFARDAKAVYIAQAIHTGKNSGMRVQRIAINLDTYLKQKEVIPYPGDD